MKKLLLLIILIASNAFSQSKTCFDVARKGTLSEIVTLYNDNPKVVDSVDSKKSSMLILACYHGNDEVAHFLLSKSNNIDFNSGMGSALMACAVKGNNKIAKEIIELNADLNQKDDNGETALIYAAMFENIQLVKWLLEKKADKSIIDKKGKTAFEYAVFSGNEEIINLLK